MSIEFPEQSPGNSLVFHDMPTNTIAHYSLGRAESGSTEGAIARKLKRNVYLFTLIFLWDYYAHLIAHARAALMMLFCGIIMSNNRFLWK